MPFSQIAKKLDVSTGTVRLHYQKMIEIGALQIAAITNPLLIGQSKMAMIGIKADGYRLRDIAKEISAFEEITYLVISTGSFDFFAEVVCKDKNHLLDFLTNKLYKIEGVRDSETFMFLEIIKEDYM
jgi:Lrp/AsnC family transcriptional regulator for asnA, asnC and gidA